MNTNELKQEIIHSLRDYQFNMHYLTCAEVKPSHTGRMKLTAPVRAAKKRSIPFYRKISKIEIPVSHEI